jgi:DNA-binding transcriptional LysR family regulator
VETKIDFNRVAVFVCVAERGSFTAAARALQLPISSVSRTVARLEEELGVQLLARTTRKLKLTEAGQQFFARMQAVLTEAQVATTEVQGHAREPHGRVRITVPTDAGLLHLADVVTEVLRRHPRLEIEVTATARRLDLVEEGIDLAIRGGHLNDSSLVARKVGSSVLGVVAAPSYLQGRGRPRTLADLAKHDCIRFRTRAGGIPWRLRGPEGETEIAVTGSLICDDMAFLYHAVRAGAGLGLVSLEVLGDDLAAGRLVRLLPRHALSGISLYVVWPAQRLLPARVALVRDILVTELGKLFG